MATQNEAIDWEGTTPVFRPEQNIQRFRALRDAIVENRLWTLQELIRTHAGQAIKKQARDTDAYYAQVWSFVLFLKQSPTYRPKLLDMIRRAHDGHLHEALDSAHLSGNDFARSTERWNTAAGPAYVSAYLTGDLPGLEKEYLKFIHELTAGWPPKSRNSEF
jgi:hypothetical protein